MILHSENQRAINERLNQQKTETEEALKRNAELDEKLGKEQKKSNEAIADLEGDIHTLQNDYLELLKTAVRLKNENDAYRSLLSAPFAEIAEKDANFKAAYEQQMELMADWMVSQKAFKELAIEFGLDKGYSPEQVIEMGRDKEIDVLEDRHNPDHNTNAGDGNTIAPKKEKLVDRFHKNKAARQARKGS